MAKARITLLDNGPITFEGNGHRIARGESKVITTESDILYFQQQVGFNVEFEEGPPMRAAKVAKAEIAPAAKGPAKKKAAPPPPPPVEEPVDGLLTAEQLDELTPEALGELLDGLGYEVPEDAAKSELVKLILAAQADES
jgi:hypothetical protein